MRTTSHPLGPVPANQQKPADAEPQQILQGAERESLLSKLNVILVGAEDDVLLEDEHGHPWVDRAVATGSDERELVKVSWREVCLNWPDAMCRAEAEAAGN